MSGPLQSVRNNSGYRMGIWIETPLTKRAFLGI